MNLTKKQIALAIVGILLLLTVIPILLGILLSVLWTMFHWGFTIPQALVAGMISPMVVKSGSFAEPLQGVSTELSIFNRRVLGRATVDRAIKNGGLKQGVHNHVRFINKRRLWIFTLTYCVVEQ